MSKTTFDMLISKASSKWGATKTIMVLFLATVGAGSFGSIGICLIPNEPDQEETKNVIKSTKTKKENV